jgi:translocation and assembly module TamB
MRKRFKIPLLFFLFILLILGGTYLLLTQTNILEGQVNYWANYFLAKSYPVQVRIGDIKGSFFDELIVKDFSISYTGTDPPYDLLKSKEVTLRYSLLNWWKGRKILSYVGLKGPEFEIKKVENQYLLPLPQEKDTSTKDSGPSYFRIDTLKIENGSFALSSEKDEERIESLNLELSFEQNQDTLNFRFFKAGLSYARKGLNIDGVEGGVDYAKDELIFKDFRFRTDHSQLEISGRVAHFEKPEFSFDAKTSPLSLDELKELFGIGLSGKFDIQGSFKGNLHNFGGDAKLTGELFERKFEDVSLKYSYQRKKLILSQVQGRGFSSPLLGSAELDLGTSPVSYTLETSATNLDLAEIVSTGFHTDFSGSVSLEGKGFSEEDFFMKVSVDLKEGRIQDYTFSQAKGDLSLDFAHIHFHPDFLIVYKNTRGSLEGDIHYDEKLSVKAKADFADLNDFQGQIFLKELSGRGKADLEFDGALSDLNVKGKVQSDSLWIYKWYTSDLSGGFQILNFFTSRAGFLDLGFSGGTIWGTGYDSVVLRLRLEDEIVKIDSAWAMSKNIDLSFSGLLDYSVYPSVLDLERMDFEFEGNLFQSEGKVEVDVGKDSVNIRSANFRLGEGNVELSGLIESSSNIDLKATLSEIDIAPWIARVAPQRKMAGITNAHLALRGSFDRPEISLKGKLEGYKFEELDLGGLAFDLSYRDKRLDFTKLEISHPDAEYALTGYIPLDLSLTSSEKQFLDQPQNMIVRGQGKTLNLLLLLLPWMEYVEGPFQAEVNVSGTPFSPQFEGSLTIDSGSLKIKSLEDPATDLRAELLLADQNLKLQTLEAQVSHKRYSRGNIFKRIWRSIFPKKEEKGKVSAEGEIIFRKLNQVDYDVQVKGLNVPFRYELADLSGISDFNLRFKGTDPASISGDLFFHQLLYQEPFGALSSPGMGEKTDKKPLDLNLKLSADNNCWIINQDMNVEFKGEVRVVGSEGALRLLGNLETIRGKYFLFGNTFEIQSGSFTFNNAEKIDPELDLSVSADIATGYSPTERNEFVKTYAEKVQLSIQGTLSAPDVQPSSDSPYSKEEILELLAFRQRFFTADTLEMGSLFQDGVLKSLGGAYGTRLLENIATRSLGVETFEIEPAWAGKFSLWDTRITIGKYISDKIYFTYTHRLSQSTGEEAGVEYRLKRYLFFQGLRDKEGKVYLGLNLHWEY